MRTSVRNMDRAWLGAQLEAGRSIESLAREAGRHPSTVAYWVNKHGLSSSHARRHAARGGIDRATLGNPGKLTCCFAEREEGSPFAPLSADRGVPGDAVTLFAGSGLQPVVDGGRIMRTLAGLSGQLKVDVLRGGARFRKYGEIVEPAIVHFAAGSWSHLEYRREALRLALRERGVPAQALAPLPSMTRLAATGARRLRRAPRQASSSLAVRTPPQP